MIPDLGIYRSANVLVTRHGQDAPIHAAMRADAMLTLELWQMPPGLHTLGPTNSRGLKVDPPFFSLCDAISAQ